MLVQWLRDNLDFFDFSQHVEDYSRQVPDSGGIYLCPCLRPSCPTGRPTPVAPSSGWTRSSTRATSARRPAGGHRLPDVRSVGRHGAGFGCAAYRVKVDGGMVHNTLLMQFQADILGVPVVRPVVAETTASAWRTPPGWPWAIGPTWTTCAATGRLTVPGSRRWTMRRGRRCTVGGRRLWGGRCTGWTNMTRDGDESDVTGHVSRCTFPRHAFWTDFHDPMNST